MKKRCFLIKNCSIIFVLLLLISNSLPTYALTDHRLTQSDLINEYLSDEYFIEFLNESPQKANELLNKVVTDYFHDNTPQNRPIPQDIYIPMVLVRQPNEYYCGPTSAYMSISGWGGELDITGSTRLERLDTLANAMGTTTSGTNAYTLTTVLNNYLSSNLYTCYTGSTLSKMQFRSYIENSLSTDRAPILHVYTDHLSYYHSHRTGHFITLEGRKASDLEIRLYDCHNSNCYFGIHDVEFDEAYDSIHEDSSRHVICYY